jgi:thiamine-phosphate diphosphorylase
MKRGSIRDIFRSNIRRSIEASRVIEEYSKNIDQTVSARFQEIRFHLYDLEKRGWGILEKKMVMERFKYSLYAIIDSGYVKTADIEETAEILSGSGADIIQLRMKDVPDREFLLAADKVSDVCRKGDTIFIVNDRPDIAVISGAHGIHVGQDDIPLDRLVSLAGQNFITGLSIQSLDDADAATDADYIAVSPVFPTVSKTEKDGSPLKTSGIEEVKKICSITDKPVVAIGGINLSNAAELLKAGVSSLAVISALYTGGDLQSNTRDLLRVIKSFRTSL